jgi:hypothetical protein
MVLFDTTPNAYFNQIMDELRQVKGILCRQLAGDVIRRKCPKFVPRQYFLKRRLSPVLCRIFRMSGPQLSPRLEKTTGPLLPRNCCFCRHPLIYSAENDCDQSPNLRVQKNWKAQKFHTRFVLFRARLDERESCPSDDYSRNGLGYTFVCIRTAQ